MSKKIIDHTKITFQSEGQPDIILRITLHEDKSLDISADLGDSPDDRLEGLSAGLAMLLLEFISSDPKTQNDETTEEG